MASKYSDVNEPNSPIENDDDDNNNIQIADDAVLEYYDQEHHIVQTKPIDAVGNLLYDDDSSSIVEDLASNSDILSDEFYEPNRIPGAAVAAAPHLLANILRRQRQSQVKRVGQYPSSSIVNRNQRQRYKNFNLIASQQRQRKLQLQNVAHHARRNTHILRTYSKIQQPFPSTLLSSQRQPQLELQSQLQLPGVNDDDKSFGFTSHQSEQPQRSHHHTPTRHIAKKHKNHHIIRSVEFNSDSASSSNTNQQLNQVIQNHIQQPAPAPAQPNSQANNIAYDRVEILPLESAASLPYLLAGTLVGVFVIGALVVFWLKKFIFKSPTATQKTQTEITSVDATQFLSLRQQPHQHQTKRPRIFENPSQRAITTTEEPSVPTKMDIEEFYSNFIEWNLDEELKTTTTVAATTQTTPIVTVGVAGTSNQSPLYFTPIDRCSPEAKPTDTKFIFPTTASVGTSTPVTSTNTPTTTGKSSTGSKGKIAIGVMAIRIPLSSTMPAGGQQQKMSSATTTTTATATMARRTAQPLKLVRSFSAAPPSLPPLATSPTGSPTANRRLKRFSSQERRSYSPNRFRDIPMSSNATATTNTTSVTRLVGHQEIIQAQTSPESVYFSPLTTTTIATSPPPRSATPKSANVDDKENAHPFGSEMSNSPKMKISEQALAQQNSPRVFFFDSPPATAASVSSQMQSRFTFTQMQQQKLQQTTVATTVATTNCSPALSSAIYKHGNYFRFPEVDCLSPATAAGKEKSPAPKPTATTTATTRRARLKSISLDSDNARLVEDNLGVPVEELIEVDNLSPTLSETEKADTEESRESTTDATPQTESIKYHRKNKNHLTININITAAGSENLGIDEIDGHEEKKDTPKKWEPESEPEPQSMAATVATPKTPTLTQTKQKAISLDSSDSSVFYYVPPICTTSKNATSHQQLLMTIGDSSLSMPATPQRSASQLQLSTHIPNADEQNHHHPHHHQLQRQQKYVATNTMSSNRSLTVCRSVSSSKYLTAQKCNSKYLNSSTKSIATAASTPSTSFDQYSSGCGSSFVSKLGSFNENTIDDDDDDDADEMDHDDDSNDDDDDDEDEEDDHGDYNANPNYCTDVTDGKNNQMPATPSALSSSSVVLSSRRCDNNFLGSNLQTQKTSTLSLSNNNLKTLPEVMTLSDFSVDESSTIPTPSTVEMTVQQTTSKNSILQRRGSNHSLTLNLNSLGSAGGGSVSFGTLSKGLSISNYSLGAVTSSSSNCNISALQKQGSQETTKRTVTSVGGITGNDGDKTGGAGGKKSLLQRRGSNTSLTLNIRGSSCMNLSRFNSHSSLNIAAANQKLHSQLQQQNQPQQQQQSERKKASLLERRNSNTSLTLSFHHHAHALGAQSHGGGNGLSISNINLRGSICSLSSINTNPLDEDAEKFHQEHHEEHSDHPHHAEKRRFFSSDNLNHASHCSKLNQAHYRNSTNTCFGSVSDLKPNVVVVDDDHQMSRIPADQLLMESTNISTSRFSDGVINEATSTTTTGNFQQTDICSCTGVRNITTRPLSPKTTSEDFKMYLANIQLLQNATNVLTADHLRKLHYVFETSYNRDNADDANSREQQYHHPGGPSGRSVFQATSLAQSDEQRMMLCRLHQEFWDLPTNYQEKPLVFGSQAKNRYKTILPNEHSRVILDCEDDEVQEPYINANYIKGPDCTQICYIATQGPLSNTIYEYWLMIYQNLNKFQSQSANNDNLTQKIIMLTNFVENTRQKCSVYFPIEPNQTFCVTATNKIEELINDELQAFYDSYFSSQYRPNRVYRIRVTSNARTALMPRANAFYIKNVATVTKNGYNIRKFVCLYVRRRRVEEEEEQIVYKFNCYHYWYPDWPDHRSPRDVNVLLDMGLHVLYGDCETEFDVDGDQSMEMTFNIEQNPVPIIHCSAGIGRTGCLAAILNGIRHMKSILATVNMEKRQLMAPPPRVVVGDDDDDKMEADDDEGEDTETTNNKSPSHSMSKTSLASTKDKQNISRLNYLTRLTKNLTDNVTTTTSSFRMDMDMDRADETTTTTDSDRDKADDANDVRQTATTTLTKSCNFISVDILGIVCNLRLQRGGMVQNSEQYELVHRALCLYLDRLDKQQRQLHLEK